MKKICCLLSLIICVSILTACYNDLSKESNVKEDSSEMSIADLSQESIAKEVSAEMSIVETNMFEDLPNHTYHGREVLFLIGGWDSTNYKTSREIFYKEYSEDIINTAVFERNKMVEEKFDIQIKGRATTVDNLNSMIRSLYNSQDSTYDILAPFMNDAAVMAEEGFFYNLKAIPNMRLEGHWWDQNANEDLEILNKLYFTTGYISILDNDCTQCLIFNKNVAKTYLEGLDLYELVRNGDWTIDKMMELTRKVTRDDDGEPGYTYKDTWGMYINIFSPTHMFISAGQRFIQKDSVGNPIITIDRSGAVDVTNKLAEVMDDRQASIIIEGLVSEAQTDGFGSVYELATTQISKNKSLLRTIIFMDLWDIVDSGIDFDFGILPLPKFNKEQPYYYSNVSTFPVPGYAISIYAKDKDLSALVLSAISEASEGTLNEAYYEKLLKRRRFTDEESRDMLDIIFNNRVYDMGVVYNWGGIRNIVADSVRNGNNTFESTWDLRKSMVKEAMQKTIDAFK